MPAFMKLGDIKGEAQDTDHKDWVLIDTLSAGIHRTIPVGALDQQRTKGSTTLGDVHITRQLDKSSTKLQEACANGTFFKEVEIHLCTTVKNKQEPYLIYKLFDVIISSYSMHGNASGQPLPGEDFSMNYQKVEWTYVVVDPKTGDNKGKVVGKYEPATGRS
ncbi:MAG UNVERIFIED_CONTAM: type VI secretion system tube protein Hcp [Planctomycetaceae bacterium]|jgi:type VI secretion system Hcp family effector